ncbi:MAG TPA: GNAT family N-acetyltransferase [Micromonosporaceae bacterium]|nr:GNAT family N-acetyltransferase [Micromonosporaceae bacterium]
MEDFRSRPFAADDASAVADLLNAAEVAHGGEPGFTAGEIRGFAAMLLGDGKGDSRLYLSDDGTLAAVAFIGFPPPGGSKADLIGSVAPSFEGRGLGRTLLSWQLRRAADLRAERSPDAEWHAELGIDSENAVGIHLMERAGGTAVRYGFQMEAAAGDVPAVDVPEEFRVVPYTEVIGSALHAAHTEAFADHWGYQARPFDNWAPGTIHSDVFRGDLSRIAFDGDDIAAYILAYDGVEGSVYIGQVGTRRPWRKRGLAGALLSASVRAAAAAGKTQASLGVDADSPTGAVGVYERLGFHTRHKVVVYHWTVA